MEAMLGYQESGSVGQENYTVGSKNFLLSFPSDPFVCLFP